MSGLVTYESSSDEEGVDASTDQRKVGSSPDLQVNGIAQRGVLESARPSAADDSNTANGIEGALLGPTMPEGAVPSESYEELSEQDIIRHLTQATHPMISMPDSPPGSPDPAANARIQKFLELKARGVHFNDDLAGKATFRNPTLLSTMMKRAGIEKHEQYSTSLPTVLWDPSSLPGWAYKEALLKTQQELREKDGEEKKSLSAAGKRTIEFASASVSAGSSRHSTPGQQSKRRRP